MAKIFTKKIFYSYLIYGDTIISKVYVHMYSFVRNPYLLSSWSSETGALLTCQLLAYTVPSFPYQTGTNTLLIVAIVRTSSYSKLSRNKSVQHINNRTMLFCPVLTKGLLPPISYLTDLQEGHTFLLGSEYLNFPQFMFPFIVQVFMLARGHEYVYRAPIYNFQEFTFISHNMHPIILLHTQYICVG